MKNKRTVVITGAATGIGLATGKLFNQNGWRVIGLGLQAVKNPKFIHKYFTVDLSRKNEVDAFIRKFSASEKRLDCLVNNAGYQVCESLIETTPQDWRDVFAVNVEAPVQLVQGFFPFLKRSKGAVVNVSSVHAVCSSENISAYAASKAALAALTRNMAIEFGRYKIRVNGVIPGAVKTAMLKEGLRRTQKGLSLKLQLVHLEKHHLLQKAGEPADIAYGIYFLADNIQSAFITGQHLTIDGGVTIKLSTE